MMFTQDRRHGLRNATQSEIAAELDRRIRLLERELAAVREQRERLRITATVKGEMAK